MTPPRASISWLVRHAPLLHRDWIRFFEELVRAYGDIVYFRLPGVPLCFINDASYVESVLVRDQSDSIKSKNYRSLSRLLGNGLIVSNGEFWRRQRRLIQPAFHRELISRQIEIINRSAESMIEDWRRHETVDIHEEMMRVTQDIASAALLGTEMKEASRTVTSALHVLMEQYAGLGMYLVPSWAPTPNNVRARIQVRNIDRVLDKIIQAREACVEQPIDLLSMLLSARDEDGRPMTARQLRDEVVTLFLAGHETTANALSWTLYLLAQHPEVEGKLVAELNDVLGDRRPTVSDIEHLRYTNLVIRESMRLYPPVGGIGRETLTKCEIGRYSVPPGTNVFMSQWLMHRNPRYFENPNAFMPDRWTAQFEGQLPACAYFPFGAGPRLCVGASFAITEMAVMIAMIARRFRFRLVSEEPVQPVFSISLRPEGGVRMFLLQR